MKVYDIVLLQNMSGVFVMKKNTILVVEDMSINRASLVAILSDKYDIIEAVNGEDALRIMCENPGIDLILTDIMMPVMDGFEMLECKAKNPVIENIPVIVITTLDNRGDEIKALELGAFDLIIRPFDPQVLLHRIKNLVFYLDTLKREEERKHELEEALDAKEDFMSHMSHEMCTPLNGICGMLDIAMGEEPYHSNQYLSTARVSARHLSIMINNVLDMTKIEEGTLTLKNEEVDIISLTEELEQMIKPLADQKNIALDINRKQELIRCIYSDRSRILQVLMNIFSNAIKYTKPGGHICCEISGKIIDNRNVLSKVVIQDNGIGMSKEFKQKAFSPFIQEKRMENEDGSGLGLTISEFLVELMGGKICIDSELNQGTTVTLELEVAYGSKKELTKEENFADYSGKRCLLVEDNEINRQIASIQLASMGLMVDTACDGLEALAQYQSQPDYYYDIIFMDIMMPRMNGREATAHIRNSGKRDADSIVIVAMTADVFQADLHRTSKSGMDYHLSKPFEKKQMMDILFKTFGWRFEQEQ